MPTIRVAPEREQRLIALEKSEDTRNLAEKLLVMRHMWYTVANMDRE
jgi:hypothetical protein